MLSFHFFSEFSFIHRSVPSRSFRSSYPFGQEVIYLFIFFHIFYSILLVLVQLFPYLSTSDVPITEHFRNWRIDLFFTTAHVQALLCLYFFFLRWITCSFLSSSLTLYNLNIFNNDKLD